MTITKVVCFFIYISDPKLSKIFKIKHTNKAEKVHLIVSTTVIIILLTKNN